MYIVVNHAAIEQSSTAIFPQVTCFCTLVTGKYYRHILQCALQEIVVLAGLLAGCKSLDVEWIFCLVLVIITFLYGRIKFSRANGVITVELEEVFSIIFLFTYSQYSNFFRRFSCFLTKLFTTSKLLKFSNQSFT